MSDPIFANGEPTPAANETCTPELGNLMKLRDALLVLKGPLANSPSVRNQIELRLLSNEVHERILGKIAVNTPARLTYYPPAPVLLLRKHQNKCT